MSLPCLNYYRDWFYPEGTKVVPADIGEHLTPLGLAHWFAQDGAKTTDNGVTLATLCFTDAEHQLLLNVLSTNFGLNCYSVLGVKAKRPSKFAVPLSLLSLSCYVLIFMSRCFTSYLLNQLCGIYHSAMPIVIQSVQLPHYLAWVSTQLSS